MCFVISSLSAIHRKMFPARSQMSSMTIDTLSASVWSDPCQEIQQFMLNILYHIFALSKTPQNSREAIFSCTSLPYLQIGFPSYRWANNAARHAYIHKSVDAVSPLRAGSYKVACADHVALLNHCGVIRDSRGRDLFGFCQFFFGIHMDTCAKNYIRGIRHK